MNKLLLLALFTAFTVVIGCAAGQKGGGKADVARGERYFTAKCNACHPGGKAGAGPAVFETGYALPGLLVKTGARGKHNIAGADYDSLLLFLTEKVKPAGAATPAATVVVLPASPAAVPTPPVDATPTLPTAVPVAGQKTCQCTCQCPADMPAGQMQNCQCQCQCP